MNCFAFQRLLRASIVRRRCVDGALADVDPRWGARAKATFPPASGQGKTATRLQGERRSSMGLWRVFWGSTRKNLTRIYWMKGAPVTDKVTRCNLDQPCSLSAVTRHPNREESKRCAAQGCRRGKSTKPLGLLSDPAVRRGAATPDERASRASARTKESSHTAGPVFGERDECACGGPPQNESDLVPRATTQLRSLVPRHPSWRVHTI
jgi:hypothetical protein